MNHNRYDYHISHVYSLWQDHSHHTIIFDLVTLTLKFDLLLTNFNLGHNLWTVRGRAFIFHMCIPCDKTFHTTPLFWPSDLELELWITYTECCYLNLVAFRRTSLSLFRCYILGLCVPYIKTFLVVAQVLITWPWSWPLTYFRKTLTWPLMFYCTRQGYHIWHMWYVKQDLSVVVINLKHMTFDLHF